MTSSPGPKERFHYSDGSHKWIPPDPDYGQDVWDEMVRQHLEEISARKKPQRGRETPWASAAIMGR
ncbi:hypothetical protein AB0J85_05450 [Micromonospora echinofusca]|uniref:hypothetical protein n=1 Tax=Micromonospora echinofusca TaxID=47858 RepID=UPI00342221C8